MSGPFDSFHRPINYLRISVTDRCNLRCIYCMPAEGITPLPRNQILSYEEIELAVQAAAELGINKVRLSGGEPLVRAGLVNLVQMLARTKTIDDISLTTNGVLLSRYAADLRKAGLKRVNISLDSLDSSRFRLITRLGRLEDVLAGIEAARRAGLDPIKINMVVLRGINDDEVLDFARLTLAGEWHVRFIELMPFGSQIERERFMPIAEIRERIESLGGLEPCPPSGNGPAKYFRLPASHGTIGFISPVSDHFCFSCNRLRLTADGKLRPCLLSDNETDLRHLLRQRVPKERLGDLIREAVTTKPERHQLAEGTHAQKRLMAQIGG